MNAAESTTVIGRSMKVRGELSGTENLLIEGEFEGTLRLSGSEVSVGREGRVLADLNAEKIVIAGHVQGQIRALHSVRLLETALVVGDIFAPLLSIDEGAVLRGRVDPTAGAEPIAGLPVEAAPSLPFGEAVQGTGSAETVEAAETAGRAHSHFPAALAVAARQIGDASASVFAEPGAGHEGVPSESNELAESKA